MSLLQFWLNHRAELLVLLGQHVVLVVASTGVGVAAGVPLGVFAYRRPRLGRSLLAFVNIAQTLPSLALLGFLLPLPFVGGIGPRTALVALSLYALLPIVRATVTGLRTVNPAVVEAGVAVGMTPRQLFFLVELPLALPSIVAGVRVATVIGVGTATIAAAVGAGGLGEYIFRGLSMVDSTTILAGAVPAAMLAIVADGCLGWLEHRITRRRAPGPLSSTAIQAAGVSIVLIVVGCSLTYTRSQGATVTVGSKNFTEQVILGELLAQTIEADPTVHVVRKLNLGGTFVCDRGIRTGDLDAYVEYTGTAVTAVFHQPVPHNPADAFQLARELYARSNLSVLSPLGFNNTFTILVRDADARALGLHRIDDLRAVAARWKPGFGYEFLEREDGYPGLLRAYGLQFGTAPRGMDVSLIYRALATGQVDVIAGDATSALIDAFDLAPLDDSRHYFPPYEAVPVVRTATLLNQPAVARALGRLAGRITDRDMRALNAAVDIDHRDVAVTVRRFLEYLALPRPS